MILQEAVPVQSLRCVLRRWLHQDPALPKNREDLGQSLQLQHCAGAAQRSCCPIAPNDTWRDVLDEIGGIRNRSLGLCRKCRESSPIPKAAEVEIPEYEPRTQAEPRPDCWRYGCDAVHEPVGHRFSGGSKTKQVEATNILGILYFWPRVLFSFRGRFQ